MVHGFFISMGGFTTTKDSKLTPVPSHWIGKNVHPNDIRAVDEVEISDRSKGDELTKGLAIIQTGWFVIQCIARGVTGLHITELEVVTLAFASLNLITYILWWNKPLDVRCSIHVPWTDIPNPWVQESASMMRTAQPHMSAQRQKFGRFRHAFGQFFKPVFLFFVGEEMSRNLPSGATRVPTFWAGRLEGPTRGRAGGAAAMLAVAFGAIHFVAWLYAFPSQVERILWRVSSITVAAVPVVFIAEAAFIVKVKPPAWYNHLTWYVVLPLGIFTYIAARLMLLVLPFWSLRSLPPNAYEDVWWTTYLPHI